MIHGSSLLANHDLFTELGKIAHTVWSIRTASASRRKTAADSKMVDLVSKTLDELIDFIEFDASFRKEMGIPEGALTNITRPTEEELHTCVGAMTKKITYWLGSVDKPNGPSEVAEMFGGLMKERATDKRRIKQDIDVFLTMDENKIAGALIARLIKRSSQLTVDGFRTRAFQQEQAEVSGDKAVAPGSTMSIFDTQAAKVQNPEEAAAAGDIEPLMHEIHSYIEWRIKNKMSPATREKYGDIILRMWDHVMGPNYDGRAIGYSQRDLGLTQAQMTGAMQQLTPILADFAKRKGESDFRTLLRKSFKGETIGV